LAELESKRTSGKELNGSETTVQQTLTLIEPRDNEEQLIIEEFRKMDLQTLSPIECMMKLIELKKMLG